MHLINGFSNFSYANFSSLTEAMFSTSSEITEPLLFGVSLEKKGDKDFPLGPNTGRITLRRLVEMFPVNVKSLKTVRESTQSLFKGLCERFTLSSEAQHAAIYAVSAAVFHQMGNTNPFIFNPRAAVLEGHALELPFDSNLINYPCKG